MNIKDLTLGQVEELQKLFSSKVSALESLDYGKQICILQRGWVFVGDLTKSGPDFVLKNGSVIRAWGTSKGLGELAENGPLSSTKLDPVPETKFHELTVVALIKCNTGKWK